MSAISRSRMPKPLTSAPPGTRRSAVTDAVGLAPSLLPRPGAVAITVTTTALAGEWCGVVRRVRPGVRVWSGLWRVSRWVGLVLRLVFFLPVGRPHDDGPHAE